MKGSSKALFLSTISFAIAFAVWGMISPLAKTFQTMFSLTEQQTWAIIAIPVLLGSIIRIPMGMLTDKFGGRIVFGLLLLFIALPASKLFPPEKQGLALGIFGMGNIGQSIALFGIPVLTSALSWQISYKLFALTTLIWGIIFLLFARNAESKAKPKSFTEMIRLLLTEPLTWLLSLFYFVTFGGFVTLSIGLPKLLQEIFHISFQDAGFRVAGFVVLATFTRPLGGWLSDKVGGAKVLMYVFLFSGLLALGLSFEQIIPFTIGALGVAACIGLGNGAVFRLVPEYFPKDAGTVSGLVGAVGGLGGFFPPFVLGFIKTQTGQYDLGFLLLSIFCLMCMFLNFIV